MELKSSQSLKGCGLRSSSPTLVIKIPCLQKILSSLILGINGSYKAKECPKHLCKILWHLRE